jgi:hypothetical protein
MAEYIVDTTEGILHARTTGELVRCRDCKHYMRGRCDWLTIDTGGRIAKPVSFKPASDGFCAWGEKREGE